MSCVASVLVALCLALPAFATVFAGAVKHWKPKGVSSPQFESHAAFDPLTGDFYFVRSSPKFEGWRILVSQCGTKGWSEPAPPAFAGDGVEADPYLTRDGRSLYFISTRSTDGVRRKDLDIWRGCVAAGLLADRYGRTWVASAAMAVSGACCLAVGFLFGGSAASLLAIAVVWGASVVADSAQFSGCVTELADPRYVGTALTLQICFGFLLTTASTALVGKQVE